MCIRDRVYTVSTQAIRCLYSYQSLTYLIQAASSVSDVPCLYVYIRLKLSTDIVYMLWVARNIFMVACEYVEPTTLAVGTKEFMVVPDRRLSKT